MTTTITQTATRGFGYVRVSAEMGRAGKDNFHSPAQQREAIEGFCSARGIDVVDFVEAIDQSSKKGQNFETTEFQELKSKIGSGDAIVVYRFDRFGRDLRAAMANIQEIEDQGGLVLSATETNSNDSSGRLARDIFFSFAQYQLNRITEGWNSVHDRMHDLGVVNGFAPFGYDKPKVNGLPQPLVPNADAPLVHYLFTERASGAGATDLAREMSRRTGREWSRQAVLKVITNRVYLGEVRRGKRPVVKDAHEPLIDRATFEASQRPKTTTWAKKDYLLTGLVYCHSCGARMQMQRKRQNEMSYACTKNNCTSMTADLLEDHVYELFLQNLEEKQYGAGQATADIFDLERAVNEAEDDVRVWMQNTAAQRTSARLWEEELDRRGQVVAGCQRALGEAHKAAGTGSLPDAVTIKQAWPTLDNIARRKVLTAAIDRLVIGPGRKGIRGLQPERVSITWA